MPTTRHPATAALIALLSTPALAQPDHGGDVFLTVQAGRIVTGEMDSPGEFHERRVFASEFGTLGENITDEPGYDCDPGTFPIGSAVGFRIPRAVRLWDGASFTQIPAERIAVTRSTFNPPPPAFSPLADGDPVTGFSIAVSGDGRWHNHLEYNLLAPAAPGIYLLELELLSSDPSILPTRPFWLVLNKQRPEPDHDAAVEWAAYTLARDGCPADFDRDRAVSSTDISAYLSAWLAELSAGPAAADVNADGAITSADISAFLTLWLAALPGGC